MKRILALAAALMIAGASESMAVGGFLNLYWDGCSDGGASTKSFACDTNTGTAFTFYASIIFNRDVPHFAACSAIIDVMFSGATIPAWWQSQAGQCSANRIGESYNAATFVTNCPDIWQGAANLSVFQVQTGLHALGPNAIRLNGGAAVPAGSELNVIADGSERVVCRVSIARTKTVGTGSCTGCSVGACFVLNECKVQQPREYFKDYFIVDPATSNFVTWQAGGPICPQATPAHNRTWGSVKNLYR